MATYVRVPQVGSPEVVTAQVPEKKKRGRRSPEPAPAEKAEIIPIQRLSEKIENVLINGDLSKLTVEERMNYYRKVCETMGLNPYTKPFAYLVLNGTMQLYALKNCTDQLRSIHGVSVDHAIPNHDKELGIYAVVAEGHDRSNRRDTGLGVVNVKGLAGEALANAMMKAETKAKRRFTLSLCGLGILDESELESIPAGSIQIVDAESQPSAQPAPAPTAGDPIWKLSAANKKLLEQLVKSLRETETMPKETRMAELAERWKTVVAMANESKQEAIGARVKEVKNELKAKFLAEGSNATN